MKLRILAPAWTNGVSPTGKLCPQTKRVSYPVSSSGEMRTEDLGRLLRLGNPLEGVVGVHIPAQPGIPGDVWIRGTPAALEHVIGAVA
jgi:hypothetical protein